MDRLLKIDLEFQNKIPPLTEAEYAQLEENILEAGKVFDPIVVWNDTIIDGHNRYKVILDHPFVEWKVREMHFADKWDAFDWMYKNQLGRRNLTDEQKMFLIGKMYEARKHSHGGQIGNQNAAKRSDQNDNSVLPDNKQGRVVNQIAKENGVGTATVKRAEDYAKGIEEIRKEEPEFADEILKAEKKIPKINIIEVAKANPDERKEMIQELKESGTVRKRSKNVSTQEIENLADSMADDSVMEYTISMMKEQIRFNSDAFVKSLSNLLKDHSDLWGKHQEEVNGVIDEVICKIEKIKGDIE